MIEIQGINPIAVAQNLVTAKTPEELREAMKAIHLCCLTQPVETVRDLSKHLAEVTKAALMDRVREAVKEGDAAENASVALEDVENLVAPVLPTPIFSQKARQLALEAKNLSSLRVYCKQRALLLDAISHLVDAESETLSGMLSNSLADLLIFELLMDATGGNQVLARQVRLWQMLHIAREEGQMQLAPYFLVLDGENNVRLLLPCCLHIGAPAKAFYCCAGILKALAYQKEVLEYEVLVCALHEKVEHSVLRRVRRGKDDADTLALEELFVLLRTAMRSHSPLVWEYPRFEEIKNTLEEH